MSGSVKKITIANIVATGVFYLLFISLIMRGYESIFNQSIPQIPQMLIRIIMFMGLTSLIITPKVFKVKIVLSSSLIRIIIEGIGVIVLFWIIIYNVPGVESVEKVKLNSIRLFSHIFWAPCTEEIIYRLLLINCLMRKLKGRIAPVILISSSIFALTHVFGGSITAGLILGVVLGFLFVATQSIICTMALHFSWNLVVTSQLFFGGVLIKKMISIPGVNTATLVLAGFLLVLLLIDLIMSGFRLNKNNKHEWRSSF